MDVSVLIVSGVMDADWDAIDNQGMFAQVLTMESFKAAVCLHLVGLLNLYR